MASDRRPPAKREPKKAKRTKKTKPVITATASVREQTWGLPPHIFWSLEPGPEWLIAFLQTRGLETGQRRWLLLATSRFEGFLLSLTWNKDRWLVSGGPKGWSIRRDRDTATGSGEYHYHCEKNGDEYVVKADGKGSHDTKAGTELPQRLGDFLHDDLGIPLQQSGGVYVVQFLPAWTWDSVIESFAVDIVDGALNAEIGDGATPNR